MGTVLDFYIYLSYNTFIRMWVNWQERLELKIFMVFIILIN